MSYSTCVLCGRLFEMKGANYCSDRCYRKDSEGYQRLRDYVIEHQGISAMEASKATGVSMKSIMRYVESGWISTVEDNGKLSFEHFTERSLKVPKQDKESVVKTKTIHDNYQKKTGEALAIKPQDIKKEKK